VIRHVAEPIDMNMTAISKHRNHIKNLSYIHFHTRFSYGEGRGGSSPRKLEIPHGFQQSQIVLLHPHQGGTKTGRISNHNIWFLDCLWAAFPWV